MANSFWKIQKGIVLIGETTDASDSIEGSVFVNSSDSRIRTYIQGSLRELTTNNQSQTLVNKILTAPVINSPTGLVKADVGLGNVDNTSDATKNAASATLTNKTIDGDDNTVQDLALSSLKTNLSDASNFLVRNASGIVISNTKAVPTGVVVGTTDTQTLTNKTLTTPIISTISNSGTVTLFTGSDTVVGRATTDTLTNKTINGASNTLTIRAASDITGTLPIANGGTNSSTALNNNRILKSSGSAIVEAAAITASRAIISDSNGIPTHATTTATEIGYVNGVTSAIQTQLDAIVSLTFPPGVTLPYAGSTVPSAAWLFCDGSAVSRTTYSGLFAIISTTYGAGNGTTTFNVPDLRGRAVAGRDDMGGTGASRITSGGSGIAGNSLGAAGGEQAHTLITAEIPAHNHGINDSGHNHTISDPGHIHSFQFEPLAGATGTYLSFTGTGGAMLTTGDGSNTGITTVTTSVPSHTTGITNTNVNTTSITTANAGSGTSHLNVQPTIILNYIIKT